MNPIEKVYLTVLMLAASINTAFTETFGRDFGSNTSGKISIIQVMIDIMLVSIFLPLSITYINDTNTTLWDATAASFYEDYLPLLLVIGVVLAIVLPLLPKGSKGKV